MNALTILGFGLMFLGLALFFSMAIAPKIDKTEHSND
jgi:hypothetical protein